MLFQKAATQPRCAIEATSIIEEDGSAGVNERDRVRAAVGGHGSKNGRGNVKFSRALCTHRLKHPPLLNPGYASASNFSLRLSLSCDNLVASGCSTAN